MSAESFFYRWTKITSDRVDQGLLSSSPEGHALRLMLQRRIDAMSSEEPCARLRYHRSRSIHHRLMYSICIGAACVLNCGNSQRRGHMSDQHHNLDN